MHILGLELGVIGGLITPVCSCMLSESILCHSTVVRIPPREALYFSLGKKSCPGCSRIVCCAFAFLPRSFHIHNENNVAFYKGNNGLSYAVNFLHNLQAPPESKTNRSLRLP